MNLILKIVLLLIISHDNEAVLKVEDIIVRTPRPDDIGLIIDLTYTNDVDKQKGDFLDVSISSVEPCIIYTNPNENDTFEGGYILGGDMGCVEAGATDTVSLVLPTDSLFNRIGFCPIIITSTNSNDEEFQLNENVHINTSFAAIDPDLTGIRKSKNYRDCNNYDLDYLNDCKPVNCEARYFGLRNFFNNIEKRCEEVAHCEGQMIYDPQTNLCVDSNSGVSQKATRDIKSEKIKDYDEYVDIEDEAADSSETSFETLETNEENQKRSIANFPFNMKKKEPELVISEGAYIIKGVLDGIILVVATIFIYILICFAIFMIVSWISKRQGGHNSKLFPTTPSVSERSIKLPSSTTLFQSLSYER